MENIKLKEILKKHLRKNITIDDCDIDNILDAMKEACEDALDSVEENLVLVGYNDTIDKELFNSGVESLYIRNDDSANEYWSVDKSIIFKVKKTLIKE